MKIICIEVILEGETTTDEKGNITKELFSCIRDNKYKWSIGGKVYPRTLNFLAELNRLAREHDG